MTVRALTIVEIFSPLGSSLLPLVDLDLLCYKVAVVFGDPHTKAVTLLMRNSSAFSFIVRYFMCRSTNKVDSEDD